MLRYKIDYGKAAIDYRKHRHGLPSRFFEELKKYDVAISQKEILDLGTGTGDVARNLAQRGCHVTAIDPAPDMLSEAKKLNPTLKINYVLGTAEETKQADAAFDAVTVAQAYHWFDSNRAVPEMIRILKPHGQLVIASYDWKATTGVAWISHQVISRYNPNYNPYKDFYFKPLNDLLEKNFREVRLIDFYQVENYTHEDWVGRMSTTYAIGPSLSPEKVSAFKRELAETLQKAFPDEPLKIPHRCYAILARKPMFFEKTNYFAILREPGKSFVNAIAQDEKHTKPDYNKTIEEYSNYVKTLQKMGAATIVCPSDENFPDGNFVEDPYFVLDDQLIIQLNPGTPSRKDEYTTLKPYLPKNLPIYVIPKEFTIDGGDILKDGKDIYIGLSTRTQMEAIQYFESLVKEQGYHVHPVPVPEGLHLKSGMTCVKNKNYVIQKSFEPFLIEIQKKDPSIIYFVVAEEEKHAANVLAFNGHIMMPTKCPKTRKHIEQFYSKNKIHEVSIDQVRLVDGALTCCSLLFQKSSDKKSSSKYETNEPKQIKVVRSRL